VPGDQGREVLELGFSLSRLPDLGWHSPGCGPSGVVFRQPPVTPILFPGA